MPDTPLNLTDNMAAYQAAVSALSGQETATTPDACALKHRAVLALARAGATEFAQSEYERYGLDDVKAHENIMALAGRLAKDRYEASGDIEQARDSANFYEAAFQSTSGYYSGINAATMSLLANVPPEIVMGRAQAVLTRLSALTGDSREDRYYIEASRAEAHYILGDRAAAQSALKTALDYDPLNYTAHASTYRQFKLLAKAHGEDIDWLAPLRAPTSVHFAGHLFSRVKDEDRLNVAITDLIQKEDIGFAYGALAAGSDIVFAECLLAEGGELHAVLPVPVDVFKKASVEAFDADGANWSARFEACLAKAASVRSITGYTVWPNMALNNYAARISMGEACARAQTLSSKAAQLLIWDGVPGTSLTARHARDWTEAAGGSALHRPQYVLEFPDVRDPKRESQDLEDSFAVKVGLAKNAQMTSLYGTAGEALAALKTLLSSAGPKDKFGLHIAPFKGEGDLEFCKTLSDAALPGSVFVSRDMAAITVLAHGTQWETGFTGRCNNDPTQRPAWFLKLRAAGESNV
jgi:hypothetical protein